MKASSDISQVVKAIKQGKAVVCPTDTIYGLIADATSEEAIKRVLRIKKRQDKKPIPVFVKDVAMAKRLALINEKQEKFLTKVWPGKVTVIFRLKKDCNLPKIFTGTIGLRIPDYRLIKVLLEKLDRPLIGTSANISGRPGSTKIKEVLSQFEGQKNHPDLFVDAGNLELNKPSTIIDLTKSKVKILRVGALSKEEIYGCFHISKT